MVFARRIQSLVTRAQHGIPGPQPRKPSRVQHHRRAFSSHGQFTPSRSLHSAALSPACGRDAKAADPLSLLSLTAAPPLLESGRRRAGCKSRPAPHTTPPPAHGPTPPARGLHQARAVAGRLACPSRSQVPCRI